MSRLIRAVTVSRQSLLIPLISLSMIRLYVPPAKSVPCPHHRARRRLPLTRLANQNAETSPLVTIVIFLHLIDIGTLPI